MFSNPAIRCTFLSPSTFVKPRLLLSRCIEFAPCRWDGEMVTNEIVQALNNYVEFLPICPETEIGMNVPRDPLQVIISRKRKSLVQISSKRDFSALIKIYATKLFEKHKDLDGFISKSKSPSCGAYSTKLFKSIGSTTPIAIGSGLFAEIVQKLFPLLPIIEESDLTDSDLRDYFLIRIFALSSFREIEKRQSFDALREFQKRNYLLFSWFNPPLIVSMENLLKQDSERDMSRLFPNYHTFLLLLLHQRPPLEESVKNLLGAILTLSKSYSELRWRDLQELFENLPKGEVTLRGFRSALKSWATRNLCEEFLKQTFCEPYPAVFSNQQKDGC